MYDSQYRFTGRHAKMVRALAGDAEGGGKIFQRYVDVLLVAPLAGFLFGEWIDIETIKEKSGEKPASIFLDQLNTERSKLELAYQTIVLLDEKHEPDKDERISKAFRISFDSVSAEDSSWYEGYVLGGVEVLYNKLVAQTDDDMDCMQAISEFLDDFQNRYYPDDVEEG